MHGKKKKILIFALVLSMLMPLGSAFAAEENENADSSAETDENGAENSEGEDGEEEEEEEEEEDETVDLATETTAEYVKSAMEVLGSESDYTVYKGVITNRQNLDLMLANAQMYLDAKDSYTPESLGAYSDAVEKARPLAEDMAATQYEIDEAAIEIERAQLALVYAGQEPVETPEPDTVDKSVLQNTLDSADPNLVESDYTEYTWKIYSDSLENAKKLIDDAAATQADVNAAVNEITYTKGKLLAAPKEQLAIIYNDPEKGETLVAVIDEAEGEGASRINMSPEGIWVVETDSSYSKLENFYIKLLSKNESSAFVTTDKDAVYIMDASAGTISDTYAYQGEDNENGRKFVSESSGRIMFTTLETDRLLADVQLAMENENLAVYADEVNGKLALYDKKGDKYWWSTPVNPYGDQTIIDQAKMTSMKLPQRNQSASGLILQYGDLRQEKRNVTDLYSKAVQETKAGSETWKISGNGLTVTYKFRDGGFEVPVEYKLYDDRLEASVDMEKVVEKTADDSVSGKIVTALTLNPSFGAAPLLDLAGNEVEGYMVIPDGSGAIIRYNNGKQGYTSYTQQLYGRDKTTVPLNAPRVTEQAYLPLIATVEGKNGLVAIATDGDGNASVNAQVSRQNKQAFNTVNFTFNLRSSDTYYMGGTDGTRITVFEKGKIKTDKIAVSYYPISDEKEVNYADVAAVYRNYLITEKGLEKKTEAGKTNLYLDLFGGVLKETSIAGVPVDMKTRVTTFDQAEEIIKKLSDGGVTSMVANYNQWTNKSMVGKISTKFKPSGKLGGKSGFEDLQTAAQSMNTVIYPSISNMEMKSSTWGFLTLNSTAIRVSNAQSRQSKYSIAFGVQQSGKAPALLSPNAYTKAMTQMVESFTDKGQKNIGFGEYSNTLVSDFSRKHALSRESNEDNLVENYKKASEQMESIIADEANAYIIPYVDHITNVPVYSSQYNMADLDIPLYQMVIHGYVPYASTPVNANSNAEEVFMLSLASGSAIHYDMFYEEAYELIDTDFNDLYYANYAGWIDPAIKQYQLSDKILSQVSDKIITDYQVNEETGVITTTYSSEGSADVVITIDTVNATADVNGVKYDLKTAIEGGLQG